MAEVLKDFFGLMNRTDPVEETGIVPFSSTVLTTVLRSPTTTPALVVPSPGGLIASPGSGGRAAQFTQRVMNSYSGPVPSYFGYNVEQFSYILIASGCLGSLIFVISFYVVMYCKKVIDRRRNARWLAMGFSPSTDSGFQLNQAEYYARSEVFLVHFPNMPRSTTDVYLGNIGFPPLVPRESLGAGQVEADPFIQLTSNDINVRFGEKGNISLPERLV